MTGWSVDVLGMVDPPHDSRDVRCLDTAELAKVVGTAAAYSRARVIHIRRIPDPPDDLSIESAFAGIPMTEQLVGVPVTPSEVEELVAAAEAIPTSTAMDIEWVYRLHRAAKAVRRSGGDPIETGREAALGQWEERWRALRATLVLHPHLEQTAGVMDRIEAELPVGKPTRPAAGGS